MIKVPVNSRMLKALLCVSLVFDIMVSVYFLSDTNKGFCSGIEGKVVESLPISAKANQANRVDKPCPNIVLYVRDTATNKIITKVTCDDEGFFKVHLVPGRYLLEVAPTDDIMQINGEPTAVNLEEGEFESVAVRVERKPAKYSQLPKQYLF